MKPLKLIISAFGPYGGKEEIDFTKLGNKSIFLITGRTGAGKTTIFDGISYALYGETSITERNAESLRSQFAKESELTEVELQFKLKGKEYRVYRVPKQQRAKKRGEGFIECKPEATLEIFNGEEKKIITGVAKVNKKIEDLMGISGEQFRQIMMIPQGEFRKLLTSDSQERERVLRKIFDTKIYSLLQIKLDSKAKEIYGRIKNKKTLRDGAISRISIEENQENEELIKILNSEDRNIQYIVDEMEKYILQDKESLKEKEQEIDNINKGIKKEIEIKNKAFQKNKIIDDIKELQIKKEELTGEKEIFLSREERLSKALLCEKIIPLEMNVLKREEEINNTKKKIELEDSELKELKDRILEEKKEYTQLNTQEQIEAIERKKEEVIILKKYIEKVNKIEELKKEFKLYSCRLEELRQLKIQETDKREKILKTTEEKDKLKEKLSKELMSLSEIKGDYNNKKSTFDEIAITSNEYDEVYESLLQLYKEKKQYSGELEGVEKWISELELKKKELFNEFIKSQGSILAKELHHGEPCPVCGSKEHPNPTKHNAESIDIESLEKLDQQINSVKEQYNTLKNNYSVLDERYKGEERNFTKLKLRLSEKSSLDNIKEMKYKESKVELSNRIELLKNELEDINIKIKLRDEIEAKLLKVTKEIENYKIEYKSTIDNIEALSKEYDSVFKKHSESEAMLKEIASSVPKEYQSSERLSTGIKDKESFVLSWEKNIKEYENKIKALENSLSSKEGRLKTLQQSLVEFEKSIKEMIDSFKEAVSKNFTCKDEYEKSKLSEVEISELKKSIEKFNKTMEEAKAKLEELNKHVDSLEKENVDEINSKILELENLRGEIDKQRGKINSRLSNNDKALQEIKSVSEEIKGEEKEYNVIGYLAKVSRGENSYRITFERYVLAAFLEDILHAANSRFKIMTGNRYLLYRTDELQRKNKQSGLELEVYDNYTGQRRHVKTLSGGESFKASLSMALGLSDVVQSYAGGVRLDTMFIDEGFGTLDPESLDSAIACLIDLQKSGRLVGIISHVPELKERIDAQLIVKATNKGSSTEFKI
ncbi:AAA family ATPase [Oceanirhabdus seepicola]|uniref:Nuclease SbcCD subunit C n=1 Tax=Oceanirhabdus seepicola TaxID=2828781 RepID=A0A9J6P2M5_9CLOT|nr:hypothetical protein [Oceanirhabdus seepicola]